MSKPLLDVERPKARQWRPGQRGPVLVDVAGVLGVRRGPKTRLASDDPTGEVFAERLAGHRAGGAFLALRVELPHNVSSRSAADIDALLATVWEVKENGSAEPAIRGFVDGPFAG